MTFLEGLKAHLDGWYSSGVFWLCTVWFLGLFLVPRTCEKACPTCPYGQPGTERRRRYWRWRLRLMLLELAVDVGFLGWCAGRVVVDPLLGEVAWTWPLLLGFGAWFGRDCLRDLRELDRLYATAREHGA